MKMPPAAPVRSSAEPIKTKIETPRVTGETLIVYPEQPAGPSPAALGSLPMSAKNVKTPAAKPRPLAPPLAPPAVPKFQESPLPPPTFPDSLPAPTPRTLQSSKNEQRPPAKLPVIMVPDEQTIQPVSRALVISSGDDHRCLTGEVQQFRRGWRMRYAAIDVADPHGGSVSLSGAGLERLKEGARIRVTGTLIPAEDRLSSARFQVQSLEVIE